MATPIVFLDIDGVLLTRDASRYGYRVAEHTGAFIAWVVERFDTRWLSTRCKEGDLEEARRAFRLAGLPRLDPTWACIDRIIPVKWQTCKA